MRKRTAKCLRIAVEAVALSAVLFLFLRSLDMNELLKGAALITPGVVIGIIAFQTAILALGTACWAVLLREAGIYRGPWRAFLARASGFSVTYLTPSASFGGVPARALTYADSSMRGETLYATIAVDTFIEVAGKIPCIAVGLLIAPLIIPGMAAGAIAGAAALALAAAFTFLSVKALAGKAFLLKVSRRMAGIISRISPKAAAKFAKTMEVFSADMDAIVRNRKVLLLAFLLAVGIALVEVLQTFFILGVLGEAGLDRSFVIFASVLFQAVFGVLPGNLGGMEGTHAFVFTLLGMGSAAGIVYTVILRLGQTVMVLLGLLNILFGRIAKLLLRQGQAR